MDGFVPFTQDKLQTAEGINKLNQMLKKLYQVIAGDGEKVRIFYGYGSPENVVVANIAAVYMRKDGGANTSIYVKEANNDAANGWVGK